MHKKSLRIERSRFTETDWLFLARIRKIPINVPSEEVRELLRIYFKNNWNRIAKGSTYKKYEETRSRCPEPFLLLLTNLVRQGLLFAEELIPYIPELVSNIGKMQIRMSKYKKTLAKDPKDRLDTKLDIYYWYIQQGCSPYQIQGIMGGRQLDVLAAIGQGFFQPNERQCELEKVWRNKVITPSMETRLYRRIERGLYGPSQ